MKVEERDMLALSLPFTAGVAAGSFFHPSYALAGATSAVLLACLWRFYLKRPRNFLSVISLMFLCGLFCSLTAKLCALSAYVSNDGFFPVLRMKLASGVDGLDFGGSDTPGLVKALVLGDRSGLSPEVRAAFRGAGASHILALSGLHLGIFYLSLSKLLAPLGNSPVVRKIKSLTIIALSLFYVVLAGAGPSLVRALFFIILREGAAMLYRRISLLRLLLASLMIQLMITPGEILSPGFQLSYLAVAGLALVYPPMERLYPSEGKTADRFNLPRRLWQLCCVSISCQLFTAPVAWIRFGSVPKYFLLANIIALPMATVMTWLSMIIVISAAAGCCPGFLLDAADSVGSALIWVLETVCGM